MSTLSKKAGNGAVARKVEMWAIDRLIPYQNNARTHSKAQVAQIAASIKEFGFNQPILVNRKEGILAGHGRLEGAKLLELREVPVIVLDHLTAKKQRAFILADNRIALNAGWDEGMLASELKALSVNEFDLGSLGFDEAEIERLIPKAVVEDDPGPLIDRAGELQVKWGTERGQVWEIGRHRLMCGDCTALEDVAVLLNGAKPTLMVTDPPYGVDYDPDWRNRADRANGLPYGASAIGQVENDDRSDWREAWAHFPGDVAYVWHAGRHASAVQQSLEAVGFEIRSQIIWGKTRFAISRGDYHWQHEPCWYAVRKGKAGRWSGDRSQTTLWTIDHQKSETGHSTQKPIECMFKPIQNNSNSGEDVYDPFLGSGTTIVAAEQLGRTCYALEIAPQYVAVCLERLSVMGLEPRLAK